MKKFLLLFSIAVFLFSCNKDEEISQDVTVPPVIELDSEDGIYVVKIGKEVVIEPTYQNVDYAVYSWKCNGRIISDEPQLRYTFDECGSYYVTLRVDTRDASAEEEIRVDVNELAPPVISLVTPTTGLKVVAGREYILTPDIQNAEGATYTASFTDMALIGSIAMTELYSAGGLTIKNCKEISTIELPGLTSCGEFSVDANKVNKFNISALRDAFGNMTLSNLLIEELDLSRINFNGNTLTLQCDRLNKIVGSETFNGNLLLLPQSCRLTEFTLEGILNMQGNFECKDYFYVKRFIMPFVNVAGDITIALNSGSVDTGAEIEFPKLQEIGGALTLGENTNANKIDFPLLKRILGLCSVTTSYLKDDIEFSNLESIGTEAGSTQAEFNINKTNILCPKLKTIHGGVNIITDVAMFGMTANNISYPNVESISGDLSITCPFSAFGPNGIESIDFSGLKSVKSINISGQGDINNFSTFKYLFENNILTEASQWTVTDCDYNPTFQDMKEGRYTPAE